jgi:hypothetical protein
MPAAEDDSFDRVAERSCIDMSDIRAVRHWIGPALLLVASTSVQAQVAVRNQGYIPFSEPPINYRSDDLSDPVAKLAQRIEQGSAKLEYNADHGYLPSVLKLLNVPIDSQTLVFSKTSFQYPKISPEHPRALYFNDDVYVGSVHEGKAVEIVSFDPMQGAIFYLLDERKAERPAFQRAELDCTQCHIAAGTRGIPGVLLRSVYPTAAGTLVAGAKSFITDQESPIAERWGGWYLTNAVPGIGGMANAAVPEREGSSASGSANTDLAPLARQYTGANYLSGESDLVAHLVLAHQTQMHNLITLTNYKTRLALFAQNGANGAVDNAPGVSDSARQQYERPAEQLIRYLLFVNEAPLPKLDGPKVIASSAFAQGFSARGLKDPQGRSLRDFDLSTRVFRYPCSYLIYSDAFDQLPEPSKGYVYHRLLDILSGQDASPEFAGLTALSRRAILEILLTTKPGLPAEWQSYAKANHLAALNPHPGEQSRLAAIVSPTGVK